MILNLGCGKVPLEGAVNHDIDFFYDWVDITHDLNERPWPWEDDTFDEIYAAGVLEHLESFIKSLEECHRILKIGGKVHMQLPNFMYERSHDDPTHRWFFTIRSMDYFIEGTPHCESFGFYSKMRWIKDSVEKIGTDIWFVLEKAPCVEHFS